MWQNPSVSAPLPASFSTPTYPHRVTSERQPLAPPTAESSSSSSSSQVAQLSARATAAENRAAHAETRAGMAESKVKKLERRIQELESQLSALQAENAALQSAGGAAQARPPESVQQLLYAVGDYEPQDSDEMRLTVGDGVFVNLAFGDGWGSGLNTTSNISGIFPLSHVSSTPPTSGSLSKLGTPSLPITPSARVESRSLFSASGQLKPPQQSQRRPAPTLSTASLATPLRDVKGPAGAQARSASPSPRIDSGGIMGGAVGASYSGNAQWTAGQGNDTRALNWND
ncbi:hypothetical protein M427DRAFT_158873 [Gonapodya prolifera JEL478]|uniref:SH3 domain-containing protein n=1 Tax=Gonapodya prolifera (strain JEL478) TaxID=1344416 RepID=A0A139A227_GONPJ|nr:hypothetical protein M427DRAFT_158873 [Gonapodya prolifera JEL478]|eukprot:KXS10698.1 hypothetical protein M427DRAFT_158873 [Gonapodya prolifera JEL478]